MGSTESKEAMDSPPCWSLKTTTTSTNSRAYVQIAGFEYRPALDGASAALREALAGFPSAVILDLMLPDIDGFEVCQPAQERPRPRSELFR